jgi:phosphoribosyl 1,2-cyclic phosphodiesterase
MYIKCWGSRGSISVSGTWCNRYGGDTTCLEIRSEKGDLIVVDAGSGIRALGCKLLNEKENKFDLLFANAHLDHVSGFPFFLPVYRKDTEIIVHGNPFDYPSYRVILRGLMTEPYHPFEFDDIPAKLTFDKIGTKPFKIGSLSITPILLSHPNGGMGFKFQEKGRSFVFLTDNELEYIHPNGMSLDAYIDFCKGADLLIHDAEYTPKDYNRTWGHSMYTSAVDLGIRAGVKKLGLFHHNQKRTDDQVDKIVHASNKMVVDRRSKINVFAVGNSFETRLK